MSKINPKVKTEITRLPSGGRAANQDNLSLLKRCVMANLLWENLVYVDGISVSKEIERLVPLCNADDVANVTLESRQMQKLRHTPLFLICCMLKSNYNKQVEEILPKIITRADMLSDMLALYFTMNKKDNGKRPSISNSLKKGLAKSFHNFKEYHFAKYDRNNSVKLRDVMFLVHPTPRTPEETELFKKIASRTLDIPDTWEVALSTGKDKNETWTRLIQEGKIGGLAMLRNIRNMKLANVDKKTIVQGLQSLKSNMLLPLNFLSSSKINPEFSREIEDAMIESYKNLPKLSGKTLFIVDVSGSMGQLTSGESAFSRLDQACAMAMLAINQCEDYELVITAGSDGASRHSTKRIQYPNKGFAVFKQITEDRLGGGGIFTRQCLEWCKENIKDSFERTIIFSDSQDYDRANKIPSPFSKYNYICDVSAHTRGVNFKNIWTAEISGWSEHFLTYIGALEGLQNSFEQ